MKGDILIIDENHKKAAKAVAEIILEDIRKTEGIFVITVAGESGAGKSETAASLAEILHHHNIETYIFQQDDYFILPPASNAEKRRKDIRWVGPQEVRIDLLDQNIMAAMMKPGPVEKPIVDFKTNSISTETMDPDKIKALIAEGTYTTLLENVHCRVFIDRNRFDTAESRAKRAREKQDEFLESILAIEHNIISKHKDLADIIITRDWEALKNE
ncbi:MAG: hypothetical protein JXA03_05225 [Bacteroidales bacterium]|nr:hypothetical protein [Bacteroidales bacterium]